MVSKERATWLGIRMRNEARGLISRNGRTFGGRTARDVGERALELGDLIVETAAIGNVVEYARQCEAIDAAGVGRAHVERGGAYVLTLLLVAKIYRPEWRGSRRTTDVACWETSVWSEVLATARRPALQKLWDGERIGLCADLLDLDRLPAQFAQLSILVGHAPSGPRVIEAAATGTDRVEHETSDPDEEDDYCGTRKRFSLIELD